jgi:hypothetical protein
VFELSKTNSIVTRLNDPLRGNGWVNKLTRITVLARTSSNLAVSQSVASKRGQKPLSMQAVKEIRTVESRYQATGT